MSDPVMIDDLPVGEVDLLGAENGPDHILGNAVLADLLSGSGETAAEKAALTFEDDQLAELATPAVDLLKVVHKLAMAVRLGGWCLEREPGTYGAALSRLLGSTLSDVIVLRQAEMRRLAFLERATAAQAGEVLAEAREVRTEVVDMMRDLAARIVALEAGGKPEAAT